MSYRFTFSKDTLSVFLNNVPVTIDSTHPKWEEIFNTVVGKSMPLPASDLEALINTRQQVVDAVASIQSTFGRVTVGFDGVMLDGKPVNTYLTNRMMEMIGAGIDIAPWARFMDKLYSNPSKTSIDELYLWLEKSNMPLTENGNFLAYKIVDENYRSYHASPDGTHLLHTKGEIVEMPRNEVDDRRENTCSQGLHFCSYHYLPSYGNHSKGKIIVLEINPADVVSIPNDYDNAKGRAHRYMVGDTVAYKEIETFFNGVIVADTTWEESKYNEDVGLDLFDSGMVDLDASEIDFGDWNMTNNPVFDEDGADVEYVHVEDPTITMQAHMDRDMTITTAHITFG